MTHEHCAHYQYIDGRLVEVDKDYEWYDYCTDDPDEDDQ